VKPQRNDSQGDESSRCRTLLTISGRVSAKSRMGLSLFVVTVEEFVSGRPDPKLPACTRAFASTARLLGEKTKGILRLETRTTIGLILLIFASASSLRFASAMELLTVLVGNGQMCVENGCRMARETLFCGLLTIGTVRVSVEHAR
jgi:hypothetical protein